MHTQSIAIDMDEVIADTSSKMQAWYARDFGVRFTPEELEGREIKELVPSEHSGIFLKYLNTPDFFRDLQPMPDAQQVLEALNEAYDLYIVSAAMEFPNSLKDKYDWLEEFFPFIQWQQVCLCGSKRLVQTDIMIDDRTRNFSHFRGRKLLFTAHHNIHEQGYDRIHDWNHAAQLLLPG